MAGDKVCSDDYGLRYLFTGKELFEQLHIDKCQMWLTGGIKIEGEKKVLGTIVVLIFIIVVVLAILVSINDQGKPSLGTAIYAGNIESTSWDKESTQDYTIRQPASEKTPADKKVVAVSTPLATPQVIIVTPLMIADAYERARSLVLGSSCYHQIGDLREITYHTGLVGTKFIANMLPSEDYSYMTVIIGVKLNDKKYPVYYEEFPVTVDLGINKITSCKHRQISLADLAYQRW